MRDSVMSMVSEAASTRAASAQRRRQAQAAGQRVDERDQQRCRRGPHGTRQPQGSSPSDAMPAAIERVPSGGWASERRRRASRATAPAVRCRRARRRARRARSSARRRRAWGRRRDRDHPGRRRQRHDEQHEHEDAPSARCCGGPGPRRSSDPVAEPHEVVEVRGRDAQVDEDRQEGQADAGDRAGVDPGEVGPQAAGAGPHDEQARRRTARRRAPRRATAQARRRRGRDGSRQNSQAAGLRRSGTRAGRRPRRRPA